MKQFYLSKPLIVSITALLGLGGTPILANEQADEYNCLLVKHTDGSSQSFLLDEIRHLTFTPETDSFVISKKSGESHTIAFEEAPLITFITSEVTSSPSQRSEILKSHAYQLPNGEIAVCSEQETTGLLSIAIIDMNGRICHQQTATSRLGEIYVLQGTQLKEGIYMILLKTSNYTETIKYLHSQR